MERIDREKKKEFMEKIRKAGDPDNYKVSWNAEGAPYKIQKKANIKKGGTSKARGARFELKVRKDLEVKGRIVDKWNNNVDLDEGKVVMAKRKYNPFKKMLIVGTGFPDFISIKYIHEGAYSVIGVEVKMNGILSKEEKEKCKWYLQNKVFSEIWIAKAVRKGRKIEIEYIDFAEKYNK